MLRTMCIIFTLSTQKTKLRDQARGSGSIGVNPLPNLPDGLLKGFRPSCLPLLHTSLRQFHIKWPVRLRQIIREGLTALAGYRFPGCERFDQAGRSLGSWHRKVRSCGASSLLRATASSTAVCAEGSEACSCIGRSGCIVGSFHALAERVLRKCRTLNSGRAMTSSTISKASSNAGKKASPSTVRLTWVR